jgi:hypothetical protein
MFPHQNKTDQKCNLEKPYLLSNCSSFSRFSSVPGSPLLPRVSFPSRHPRSAGMRKNEYVLKYLHYNIYIHSHDYIIYIHTPYYIPILPIMIPWLNQVTSLYYPMRRRFEGISLCPLSADGGNSAGHVQWRTS